MDAIKGFRGKPNVSWSGGYQEFEGIPPEARVDKDLLRLTYAGRGAGAP